MPDYKLPPLTPAPQPVVVTPIPAKQSRTLWFANIVSTLGAALALLPELASDPLVVAFLDDTMSPGARRTFGLVMFAIGFYLRHLRKDTNAPIIGTPAASPPVPMPGEEGTKR